MARFTRVTMRNQFTLLVKWVVYWKNGSESQNRDEEFLVDGAERRVDKAVMAFCSVTVKRRDQGFCAFPVGVGGQCYLAAFLLLRFFSSNLALSAGHLLHVTLSHQVWWTAEAGGSQRSLAPRLI